MLTIRFGIGKHAELQIMQECWTKMSRNLIIYVFNFLDTFRPRQNGNHFANDCFKVIFLYEMTVNIDLDTYVAQDKRQAMSEPMMSRFNDMNMRHSTSMG